MERAEELARKAFLIVLKERVSGDLTSATIELTNLFQQALDAPVKFVDGFVPDEKGWYWYQNTPKAVPKPCKVSARAREIGMYFAGTWEPIDNFLGRWSHRLQVEGE